VSPWRLWRPGVGCRHLRKVFDCRFSNSCGARADGRIRWGTQMRLTGELMFLLFAASNGGERRSSRLLVQMPSRQAGTARNSIGLATDEI
jgi:hypothetical protein